MAEVQVATPFQKDCCVICKLGFEDENPVHMTKKGILTLIDYSAMHGRDDLHTYLNECIGTDPIEAVVVHSKCCRLFTDKRRLDLCSSDAKGPSPKQLRSSSLPFNWKENCMLCGKSAVIDTKHPERQRVHKVFTIPMRCHLLECCKERGDLWGSEVENRLQGCIDLVAAEAVYHDACFSKFTLKRNYSMKKAAGRCKLHNYNIRWYH